MAKTARMQIRLPEETRDQVYELIDLLGIQKPHFYSMAFLRGVHEVAHDYGLVLDRESGEWVDAVKGEKAKGGFVEATENPFYE